MRSRLVVGLAAVLALGCGLADTGGSRAREEIFPPLPEAARRLSFPPGASLHVLYWPAGGCQPCNVPALRALSDLILAHPEITVTMMLPEGLPSPTESVGMDWPGRTLTLESQAFRLQLRVTPLPRIEVWDQQGRLLLLRSLPPNAAQGAAIGDEILWAKAVAAPPQRGEESGR